MSWQRVAAVGLLVGGAIAAAAFHNDGARGEQNNPEVTMRLSRFIGR